MTARSAFPAKIGRRGATARRLWRDRWAYIFIAPFFLLYSVFGLFPILYAFYLSLTDWDALGPQRWVGLANYARLLTSELWWKALGNTVWLMAGTLLPTLAVAMTLASVLNSRMVRFKDFFRAAFFMPVVAPSVAVALIFAALYGEKFGLLNYLLAQLGLPRIDWLGDPAWIKPAIAVVVVWRSFGWYTVIYLAGLQSIPTELYEAARVDGARPWDIFLKITLPLMRPILFFTLILGTIGSLQLFEEPAMLTGLNNATPGGADWAGLTSLILLYTEAFRYAHFGYAAAVSYALFVVIVTFSFFYSRLVRRNLTD